MSPKIIKLNKSDDIVSVVKQIRKIKDREVIFELEKGSTLLRSSDNLKLMKSTGEAMGKKILVTTDDEVGRVLAKKAGVLNSAIEVKMPKGGSLMRTSQDIKVRFSDIASRPIRSVQNQIETMPLPSVVKAVKTASQRVSSKLTKTVIISLIVLVAVFLALAVLLPRANIEVYARSEPITRDLEITVDKTATNADPVKLTVPAILINQEVSKTKNFETSGINPVGTNASGEVVIYNNTSFTLPLKAATTTLLVDGKKYFFTKDQSGIRPNAASNPVSIVAELPGEAYNLLPNQKFEIINTALGNRDVYGMNPKTISGGAAIKTKVLSQKDLDEAREILIGEILKQLETDLSDQRGVAVKIPRNGITLDVLADAANQNVGDETESFDMTLIIKVAGVGFSEDDIKSVAVAKIQEVLSADKYLLDEASKQVVAAYKTVDIQNGRGVLTVHFETVASYQVDSSNLTKILAGKTESEIKEIMLSKPEEDDVKVEFWPSWLVHKAPRLNGRIEIETILSE